MAKLRSTLLLSLFGVLVVTSNFGCGGSTAKPMDAKTDAPKTDGSTDAEVKPDVVAEVATDVKPDATDAEVATEVPVDRPPDTTDVPVERADAEVAAEVPPETTDGGPDVTPEVSCTNVCTLAAKQCGAGGGTQTCVTAASGCTVWSAETACGAHQTCSAGNCACVTAPAGCTQAGTFCSGGEVKTCARDAQECLFVSGSVACATNQSCKGTIPGAACSCDNTCATVGAFCKDSKHTASCVADSNSPACKIEMNVQLCPGTSSCVGGACACPAAGTTTGTGCTLGAAALCEGDDILTCVTDSDSGCNIWQASTHCGNNVGGRLTCGSPAGSAICVCPANGTNDEYVDPAAGSDTAAGVYPTGIQLPASCRWATLTKGLTMVPLNGRVIATSASAPVSFGAESFPLNVPAGVQLTTSDATATPANYTINFNSGSAVNAVVLASGSLFRGYALTNTTGNAAASAVACSSGTATVDTVNIDGSGTTTLTRGIDISGSCAAALNAVNVTSIGGVAINVSTSSSSVGIAGGSVTNAAVGLRVQSGGVSASSFNVNTNAAGISLETGSPSLALTGGTVTANGGAGAPGINVAKGTLTATGTNVNANLNGGIALAAGTTVTLTNVQANGNGTGAAADGVSVVDGILTATGLQANTNSRSGVAVTGTGSATLHGAAISGNTTRGVHQTGVGSVVLIDAASIIGPNTGNNVESGAGTVTIVGGTEIRNSGGNGVALLGAVAVINGVNIHDNSGNGIYINSTNVTIDIGSTTSVTQLYSNGGSGLRADAAGLTPSNANPITIETAKFFSNGLNGIHLSGVNPNGPAAADVAATIQRSTINANSRTGVVISQGVGATTRTFFQVNDIFGNNTAGSTITDVGGLLFSTSSTLQTFITNKVHSNVGDEMGFGDIPNLPALEWNLSTASGTCDAQANELYCDGTGNVSVRVLSPSTAPVNAQHVHWTNPAPTFNVDYSHVGLGPPPVQVDVSNACAAIATCP